MRRAPWLAMGMLALGCSGVEDPLEPRAGAPDFGVVRDASAALDAGPPDRGAPLDGAPLDASALDAAPDATAEDLGAHDMASPDAAAPFDCELPGAGPGAPLSEWIDGAHRGWAEVGGDTCRRRFTLHTSQPLRDAQPANPRVVEERDDAPKVRTNSPLFDALYALALEEAREDAVDAIRDDAFNDGRPVPCPPGGCYETGRLWHYVWTRDTAYAAALGLASLDPQRVLNSLEFKLSEPTGGGDPQIMQDTGTGGSYPTSTDRVVWAFGAAALLPQLQGPARAAFAQRAFTAMRNTAEHDRAVVFDGSDGLYRGEQSFLDWREQSYPAWTAEHVAHIGMSKALSTNIGHLRLLELTATLADELGADGARYQAWADALRDAIRARLWVEEAGLFAAFLPTGLDPGPARQFDLLGNALAVITGVATPAQAARVTASYPHVGAGAPVIWPQQQFTRIYHNRGVWPFVTAFWLRAARVAGNVAVVERAVDSLMRGAALNLSNMENFEMLSGAPFVEDGPYSGPVVNSQRQLWSVAGYLTVVHEIAFGLYPEPGGLRVDPFLSEGLWGRLFGAADRIVLEGYRHRGRRITVVVHRPGRGVPDPRVLPDAEVRDGMRLEVHPTPVAGGAAHVIEDVADYRTLFGPKTPEISDVGDHHGALRIRFGIADEAPEAVQVHVYRDGEPVATLPGDATDWVDEAAALDGPTRCYAVETRYLGSGNASQRSAPICWWGEGYAHIVDFPAEALQPVGGQLVNEHGRRHVQVWADGGQGVQTEPFSVDRAGRWRAQAVYANGAGGVTTGITCAVLRVRAVRVEDGADAAVAYLPLPHTGAWGTWRDSGLADLELEAGVRYRLVLDAEGRAQNMTVFEHFRAYTGGLGGAEGPFNRANIAELKLLGP